MLVLIILDSTEKQSKKMSNTHDVIKRTSKLGGSHFEMLLASQAESVENNSKRGGSAAKGSKRISASQPPEGDSDLELLLCEMVETSHALSAAKVLVHPFHRALSYSCLIAKAN